LTLAGDQFGAQSHGLGRAVRPAGSKQSGGDGHLPGQLLEGAVDPAEDRSLGRERLNDHRPPHDGPILARTSPRPAADHQR
jgi:hypothetical protein